MRKLFAFPIAALILATSAFAQNFPSGKIIKNPEVIKLPIKAVATKSGESQFEIDMGGDFDQSYALSSFKFFFNNSDHKIKSIGLLPKDNGKIFTKFIDKDGHDPYSVRATYWKLDGVRGDEVFFDTNSKESRIIPQPAGEGEFAISGFSVNMNDFADCNIKDVHVGFKKYPEGSKMIVDFGQECDNIKYIKGSAVWIPKTYIQNKRYVWGNSRKKQDAQGGLPNDEYFALNDFKISFKNGGHFLRGFGVELFPQGNSNEVISWQDNDKDDPIEWNATAIIFDKRVWGER